MIKLIIFFILYIFIVYLFVYIIGIYQKYSISIFHILYISTLREGINLIDLKLYDHKYDTMNIRGKYKEVTNQYNENLLREQILLYMNINRIKHWLYE
jgi:hypothetical protein